MGKLKPYWVSVPSGSYCEPDFAVLVFAHYTTEAKAVAHRETELREFSYIELRSRLIRDNPDYWFSFADEEKLKAGIPHPAAKEIPACPRCGAYLEPDGRCLLCEMCEKSPF